MNRISRLIRRSLRMFPFLALLLLSCSRTPETPVPPETETVPLVESEGAAAPSYSFEDDHAAKRAVLKALELPAEAGYYEAESLARYQAYSMELDLRIDEINAQNANEWIAEIGELIGSLTLRKGVYLYSDGSEYFYKKGELPRIYIENSYLIVHRTNYIPVRMAMVYPKGYGRGVDFTADIEIRMRGNSTRNGAKPPYTFRFEEKQSLCGMDKGKRWVLLANCFDKTMLRNKLAFDFCRSLRFDFSPEAEFVELFINGEYRGLYLLCEPVTDGKQRVDIDTENGDCLLELDSSRTESGAVYLVTQSRVRLKVNKPEGADAKQVSAWTERLNEIELVMKTKGIDEIGACVDLDSFVDFYIFKEYFKDVDAYFNSTRFYLKDGVLYAGPPWDLDLSCGNASPAVSETKYRSYSNVKGYGTGTGDSADGEWNDFGWFRLLWRNADFQELVRARWETLRPLAENVFCENELGAGRIDSLLAQYRDAIDRNYTDAEWSLSEAYSPYEHEPLGDYDAEIAFLKNWLARRLGVVDALFGVSRAGEGE